MFRKLCYGLLVVLLGIIGLTGCQVATPSATLEPTLTATPVPTYTPYPTYTPLPTHTPPPTYTPFPTWTPPPTATFTPEPTPTPEPTATYTPEPTATPLPRPTAVPATSAPAASAGKSVEDIVTTMRTTRQWVESMANTINSAMGSGLLDCADWVNTIISIDVASQMDVSQQDARVQAAYQEYRQGITIFLDGAAPLTEHCSKFILGEDTKGGIPFQQWGTARIKVDEALPYIDRAIAALSQ